MTRSSTGRSRTEFRTEPLQRLLRQLSFAPPAMRVEQCLRAERLHDQIDPQANYPLDYIAYRITRYRLESEETVLLVGEAIRPDLRLIIDRLSRELDLREADDEPVQTADELAERLHVSTRTIQRWRDDGLRWRWMRVGEDERKQIVFTQSAVERFAELHPDRVRRAAEFAPVTQAERQQIITRARRLALAGDVSFNQVATHLARRTGRAVETIRQILARHDREHSDEPIFADRTGPLTPRDKRLIARAYRMGVSVTAMAQRFGRTRATIYRVIHERRAAAARRLRLSYVALPIFERDDADQVILGRTIDEPDGESSPRRGRTSTVPVDDLPEPLRPLYRQARLGEQTQRSLLVRYNYLKYKADRIRKTLDGYSPRASKLEEFSASVQQAKRIRGRLHAASLPTVLSVARRHLLGQSDASTRRLLELLVLGDEVLGEAIEAFNPSRDQKFESFLTNRLLKRYALLQAEAAPMRAHRRGSEDELVGKLTRLLGEPAAGERGRRQRVQRRPNERRGR